MDTNNELVSVVMPTRNRRVMMARTLSTVLNQSYRNIEVIIVNEASTDDTAEFLASVDDPRVSVIHNVEPGGVARARNKGIEKAQGRYIAFTDDDDLWAPEKVDAQVSALKANPDAVWSFVGAIVVDPKLKPLRFQKAPPTTDLAKRLLEINHVPGGASGVLTYTDVVRELGGFDPEFHHFADWDLWQRLAMRGPCAILPAPLLGYTRHPSASTLLGNKYDDVELVERKHADARAQYGAASPRPGLLMWIGEMALRVNDKAAARKAYSEAIELDRSWRTIARRVLAEVPGYINVLDRLKGRAVPKDVLADSQRWLGEVDLRNPF
ncbi:MAG: glycosyltransferase family 2 protein [Acidimicrobiia bacterium]